MSEGNNGVCGCLQHKSIQRKVNSFTLILNLTLSSFARTTTTNFYSNKYVRVGTLHSCAHPQVLFNSKVTRGCVENTKGLRRSKLHRMCRKSVPSSRRGTPRPQALLPHHAKRTHAIQETTRFSIQDYT